MKKQLAVILIIVLATMLIGCRGEKEEIIRMGFVPMRDGDKLIESVEPLAAMLSEEIGIKVEAFTATNYVGVVEGLGSGQVDFGFIPPFAYVLANSESNAQVALTALNNNGESSYRSQFLVRRDGEISSFEEIKSKKVAFVDPSSTSGYLFPGAHLVGEGIDIEKDIEYFYSGGHDKALQLLLNGDVDVATTFVDARQRYEKDFPDAMEKTEVLGYTKDIPNISVTLRGNMDAAMQEKIKRALLNIAETEEGAELLKELFNIHGFAEAKDEDYDIIRETARAMNVDLKESN
ncbi:phosphate/phosphite/phosphonate ABC transporters, periplasmic binding protein PhnD [Clostridium aceticum]|uniref:Phosphate/phosphite/phosphonate ABC transporters, periplasmic binding protein PhnD n=1 Tax=Clostridium aceticum TaxID=84022 RepID=A0A0D8I9F4_9CLOT|nr:phosphate/phosphite/phosphonate ABC transporter substrate-binding protein [Clostridium aceticum]AKL96312.1 phosphate/phosphite/phosphonate ABC transporters, periplasmic binding protein PhnD [Clostridium aceticum]KJF26910.1 phosphonate ABC transporter substrate-binding protein [Clostridium aceticum]